MSVETDEVGQIIAAFEAQAGNRERPIAIIARFRVRESAGSRIARAFAEASTETALEEGALSYQLHHEAGDPDSLIVYERWRNLIDLEAHLRTDYIRTLRSEIDAVMEGEPSFEVVLPA